MNVDHIIIFSGNQGSEADALLNLGFREGSNRIHPEQGTRNRKFYFENFFLEIVWVSNESEITSQMIEPTRLWERCNFKTTGSSPFGLCLSDADNADALFAGCFKYQPSYLPKTITFDIVTNEHDPSLPWTCRLPFSSDGNMANEPLDHPNGIRSLTGVRFGIKGGVAKNRFTAFLREDPGIVFENTADHLLSLEFDNGRNGRRVNVDALSLAIAY